MIIRFVIVYVYFNIIRFVIILVDIILSIMFKKKDKIGNF